MAEVQKPVTATEPVLAESTPVAPAALDTPAVVEPTPVVTDTSKTEEVKPELNEAILAEADDTKVAEEVKPLEPISSGILGYKAPGLVKSLIFSKKYFWVGDEAVPTTSLSSYLRGEKPDVAHPTAAWSSQTGKGLLYFVKHETDKKSPAGVLNLSEATDVQKDGSNDFSLKLHGHKHSFQAKTAAERDGWFLAIEAAVEEAKTSAEGIKSSESYKESLEKLGKPTVVVAGASTTKEALPKKSTDVKPAEDAERAASSSSSSDDEKKEKAKKNKSRSASRKRQSFFGSLVGKKDELKEKKEEKKEEHAEAKAEEKAEEDVNATEPVVPVAAAAAPVAPVAVAPVDGAADTPAVATEETAATETIPASTETTVDPAEAKPKPTKRSSVFGSFFEKVRSPTTEKKEPELAPVVPPKDAETVKEETPAEVAPPAVVVADAAPVATETAPVVEPKAEETTTAAPAKEKKDFSFGKLFGSKDRSKSPAATEKLASKEEAPKVEETAPKIEEIPATTEPIAPAVDAKADEVKAEDLTKETAPPADLKEKRRSSFFGSLTSGAKKEKKTDADASETTKDEKHPSKLSGLFRNPSKAVKSKKEKDVAAPKSEETPEVKDETALPAPVEESLETKPVEAEAPKSIGDVVPDAVTVGQAQPSTTPVVQASA